jgi:hypothetical protein
MKLNFNTTAKEFHDDLAKDIEGYCAWQYKDYELVSVNYNSIIPDFEAYWNAQARFREGFKVEGNKIYVPNFFTKINGVFKDKEEYLAFIRKLKNTRDTYVIAENFSSHETILYANSNKLENNNKNVYLKEDYERKNIKCSDISVENIKNREILGYRIVKKASYSFDMLTPSKQKQTAVIIEKMLYAHKEDWSEDTAVDFISTILTLPKNVITMLNNFDYAFDVPKILYIESFVHEHTAFVLEFLNEFGVDIALISPDGEPTIEKYTDIVELSLGYNMTNTSFKLNLKQDIYTKKEQKLRMKELKESNMDFLGVVVEFAFAAYVISAILFCIKFGNTAFNTWFEIIGATIVCGMSLAVIDIYDKDDSSKYYKDNFFDIIFGICLFGTLGLLFIRGCVYSAQQDSSTINDGYKQIANVETIEKDDYTFVYSNNAVGRENENLSHQSIYCYVENNSNNTEKMYFSVYIGNTELYTSPTLTPYQYIDKFTLSEHLPIGETTLTIKYYSGLNAYLYEDQITCHIYETYDEFNDAMAEYGFE